MEDVDREGYPVIATGGRRARKGVEREKGSGVFSSRLLGSQRGTEGVESPVSAGLVPGLWLSHLSIIVAVQDAPARVSS